MANLNKYAAIEQLKGLKCWVENNSLVKDRDKSIITNNIKNVITLLEPVTNK